MLPFEPCADAVLVVVLPGAPAVVTGPTTHMVAAPTASGSLKLHDAVLTSGSVTAMPLSSSPPVLVMVKRYQTLAPAATSSAEVHGPVAEAPICFSRLNPGTAPTYCAVDGSDVTTMAPNVPCAVAVLVPAPSTAGTGPTTQVAVGSTVAVATGSAGSVGGTLVDTHVQSAGSAAVPASVGSATLNGFSATSPMFSAVNW